MSTRNGWTAEQYENLKKTSPEYADLSRDEVEVLIARYGGSMFDALKAGQPTPAARAQQAEDEEGAKAEAFYARLRASEAAIVKRNADE